MRPNDAMVSACERALAWWSDHPEAREFCEPWMLRFARSCRSPKTWASLVRVAEWYSEHSSFRGAPGFFSDQPTAERVAWNLLGGDAGERWAADAMAAGPSEYSSISDVYDQLEAEADQREKAAAMADPTMVVDVTLERDALVASAAAIQMSASDWYSPDLFESLGGQKPQWGGVILVEGMLTDDKRYLTPGGGTWRKLPFPMRTQQADIGAHDGAEAIGPFTGLKRSTPAEVKAMADIDLPADSTPIWAHGLFDESDIARTAGRQISNGTKMGVSVDLVDVTLDLPDSPEDQDRVMMGELPLVIASYKIAGATQCDIQAFEFSRLRILGDLPSAPEEIEALVASGGRLEGLTFQAVMPLSWIQEAPVEELAAVEPCSDFQPDEGDAKTCSQCGHRDYRHEAKAAAEDVESFGDVVEPVTAADMNDIPETLVASGAPRPPAEWFLAGVYTGVRPVSIDEPDESGLRRIHGHVAAWGSCHIGFAGKCVDVPRGLDYASFQGDRVPQSVTCSDGSVVKAGPVVMDTVHPSLKASASDAGAHYAHTGCLAAQVRLYEDKHGLQMAGWVMPGLSDEHLARLSASDYSPDWRPRASANGGRGVVAVLAVPVSGFNLGLVASAGKLDDSLDDSLDELAIIGTSWTPHAAALASRKVDVLRRLDVPVSADLEALAASVEPPEVSARKVAVLARLRGDTSGCGCGCEGTCGVAAG